MRWIERKKRACLFEIEPWACCCDRIEERMAIRAPSPCRPARKTRRLADRSSVRATATLWPGDWCRRSGGWARALSVCRSPRSGLSCSLPSWSAWSGTTCPSPTPFRSPVDGIPCFNVFVYLLSSLLLYIYTIFSTCILREWALGECCTSRLA